MKIKRTKPGTKTSEAKHEIVKSNELNGNAEGCPASDPGGGGGKALPPQKHPPGTNAIIMPPSIAGGPQSVVNPPAAGNKRASSGHRRDKARDKHAAADKTMSAASAPVAVSGNKAGGGGAVVTMTEVNGLVRVGSGGVQQGGPPRPMFPASTGPGPPVGQVQAPVSPGAAASCAAGKVGIDGVAAKSAVTAAGGCLGVGDERSLSPPPNKKSKLDIKVSSYL